MTQTSWRHHYLPEFYLKGFLNSNDKFFIFDKQQNRFVRNGKEFSARSYFFEKNANTILYSDKKDDFLETEFFSKLDDKIAKLFVQVHSSNESNRFSLTEEEMPILQHFVHTMYWRLPHRKKILEDLLTKNGLKEFGLYIKNNDNDIQTSKSEENLIKDGEFRKSLGFLKGLNETFKSIECNTPLTILPFTKGLPLICSDNPVIFEKYDNPNVYLDDFIFPLSGNILFIRSKKTKDYSFILKILIDILIFRQGIKYVSFSDKKYYDSLNNFYDKNFSNDNELRNTIFNYLRTTTHKIK